ncbi:sodium/potassium/calcium exchanger-like protein, partial [Euroglyphus maynei]
LNLRDDLIGAILIPFGTSGPEIFSSAIGVFFTENDIGTGAIIGSGVFNILAIPAASGLAAAYFIGKSIRLETRAVLRDLTFYFISIIVLILAIKDNTVDFIDSLLFTILFVVYIGVMFYSASNGPDEQPEKKSPSIEKQRQPIEKDRKLCIQNNNNQQQLSLFIGSSHLPNLTINFDNNFKTEKSPTAKNGKNKIMKEYLNKCNEIAMMNNLLNKDNRISNHNQRQLQSDGNEKFEDKLKFEMLIENLILQPQQNAKLSKSK